MNKLQKSLSVNAIFSAMSGLILIVFNKQISIIFGLANTKIFLVIGFVLIGFTGTIIFEIIKQRPVAVLWIILQDYIWVIGSFLLIIINPFEITKAGNTSISVIALIVLFMGINQSKALAQIDSGSQKGIKNVKYERIIKANKKEVWKAISDVANYHQVAPNIDDVKIISGEGKGMVRSCSHGKNSWTETCSMWVEEQSYSFEVNTKAPDYPYPLKFLKGTWEVQEIDSNTTKIVLLFDFQYKHKYQNWLLHPILKGKFSKTAKELLNNWQKMLETKH